MFFTLFSSILISLLVGLAIKWHLDRTHSSMRISNREYIAAAVLITLLLAPGSTWLGFKIAVNQKETFNEYWNGWELATPMIPVQCTRDGPCYWEYDCDPYTVYYECGSTQCSGTGNNRTCTYVSKTCSRTEYHSCPYCDYEYHFDVQTTLGSYRIASNRLPENPHDNRWEPWRGERLPQSVVQRAGVGAPEFWLHAKARIDANNPGPVTAVRTYPNWILASDRTTLKQFSGKIELLDSLKQLPEVPSGIYNHYSAYKVKFVGRAPTNLAEWEAHLARFNAELGRNLQGDLFLVLVDTRSLAVTPDEYILALKAYWQMSTLWDRNAASKNTILVAVGTDDGIRVDWARAVTGMPRGNELMLVQIRNRIRDIRFTPQAVLGDVRARLENGRVAVQHDAGALESIIFGLQEPATRFQRVSMSGDDPGDEGPGYMYLRNEIQPSPRAKFWIFLVTLLVSGIAWIIAVIYDDAQHRRQGGGGGLRSSFHQRSSFHTHRNWR